MGMWQWSAEPLGSNTQAPRGLALRLQALVRRESSVVAPLRLSFYILSNMMLWFEWTLLLETWHVWDIYWMNMSMMIDEFIICYWILWITWYLMECDMSKSYEIYNDHIWPSLVNHMMFDGLWMLLIEWTWYALKLYTCWIIFIISVRMWNQKSCDVVARSSYGHLSVGNPNLRVKPMG